MRKVLALFLALGGFAIGQQTIYYEILEIIPWDLKADEQSAGPITPDRMACAAVHDPAPTPPLPARAPRSEVTYLNPNGLASCTNPSPFPHPGPVVTLEHEPSNTSAIYGVLVQIVFFQTANDPGKAALAQALEDYMRLKFKTDGDSGWQNVVDLRVSNGLFNPTHSISISSISWHRLSTIPFYANFVEEPYWQEGTVIGPPGYWCRVGTWALPLHLRLHGYEVPDTWWVHLEAYRKGIKRLASGSPYRFQRKPLPSWCDLPSLPSSIRVRLGP